MRSKFGAKFWEANFASVLFKSLFWISASPHLYFFVLNWVLEVQEAVNDALSNTSTTLCLQTCLIINDCDDQVRRSPPEHSKRVSCPYQVSENGDMEWMIWNGGTLQNSLIYNSNQLFIRACSQFNFKISYCTILLIVFQLPQFFFSGPGEEFLKILTQCSHGLMARYHLCTIILKLTINLHFYTL